MIRLIRFILAARKWRRAYIDMDGTLLHRMQVPAHIQDKLAWWHANLCVRPVIKRRLPLLYFLRYVLGCELRIYTNRSIHHTDVTLESLGKHWRLFKDADFHIFDGGDKHERILHGPVMDDYQVYVDCGQGAGLLVRQL